MKQKKLGFVITGIIVILIAITGSLMYTKKIPNVLQNSSVQETKDEVKDEFTGTWRGEGVTTKDYKWFVVYTFKNGTYEMTTDSDMKDSGTYVITKRFEDKSIQMTKTSTIFKKTYDIFNTFEDNGDTIVIEGMKLHRVK